MEKNYFVLMEDNKFLKNIFFIVFNLNKNSGMGYILDIIIGDLFSSIDYNSFCGLEYFSRIGGLIK